MEQLTAQQLIKYLQSIPPQTKIECIEDTSNGHDRYGAVVPCTDDQLDLINFASGPVLRIGTN